VQLFCSLFTLVPRPALFAPLQLLLKARFAVRWSPIICSTCLSSQCHVKISSEDTDICADSLQPIDFIDDQQFCTFGDTAPQQKVISAMAGLRGRLTIELSPKNGGITDISSNRERPLCSDPSSKLFPSPKLLGYASVSLARRGKRGGTSEGHSESFTSGNIHEVKNSAV
jgi:hypothetical protein